MANIWIVLVVCVGAFAVDLGKYFATRASIRDTIDAAARAASSALEEGTDPRGAALSVIYDNNQANGNVIDATKVTITTGRWDPVAKIYTVNAAPANAVQVSGTLPYTSGVFATPKNTIFASSTANFAHRDMTLVLDFSGSMLTNGKDGSLKKAVKDFCDVVDEIGNGRDRVAMVRYSDVATLEEQFTNNLSSLRAKNDGNVAVGATNIGDALKMAIDNTLASARPTAEPLIILLTDGLANRPLDLDPLQYVRDQANRAKGLGIPVYTVSFGTDADQALMQEVADITGTTHYHADDAASSAIDEVRMVFRELAAARATHFVK